MIPCRRRIAGAADVYGGVRIMSVDYPTPCRDTNRSDSLNNQASRRHHISMIMHTNLQALLALQCNVSSADASSMCTLSIVLRILPWHWLK
jgi:hypothetical protein